ncbi:PRP1 splicing factor, N-terminal-domain-containing protein [Lactifluus subvellereus]|nr:PRP1 splicing factor, N-terminal-domain-containing protein [Lactifluus subvellereus]
MAFLSMPVPASYVACLGRGGCFWLHYYQVRSDIGPVQEGPSGGYRIEVQVRGGEEPDADPDRFQDPDNEYGLFAGMTYEADDKEADKIYEQVDRKMDLRRCARCKAREEVEPRPKLQQQFADLKRRLAVVTTPNGRISLWLTADYAKGEYENSLDPREQEHGRFETPAASGTLTNFVEISQARDKTSGTASISGSATSIDLKGYLTSLDSQVTKTEADIDGIKRARMLSDSLIKSNPKHAPGWIAVAALEEHAGHMVAAQKLVKPGCEQCPKSEDVWLEAARLHGCRFNISSQNNDGKVILASAVQHVEQSVTIWLAAADLEHDTKAKKPVLRRALEHIPNSVLIPLSVELWLALTHLETPENAKAVLNKACKAVPTSHEIWIAAGRLIEQEASVQRSSSVLTRHSPRLCVHGVLLIREQWLKEIERCEVEGAPHTGSGGPRVFPDRRDLWRRAADSRRKYFWLMWTKKKWLGGENGKLQLARQLLFAKLYMTKGQIHQAAKDYSAVRAAYAAGLKAVPKDITLWRKRMERVSPRALLEKAQLVDPKSDVLWAEATGIEERSGAAAQGKALIARTLQECPTSGLLWSMAIWAEARPQRKARSVDALKKCADDPLMTCTRKIEKARQWFDRAVSAGPDIGDAWGSWGWWLKFERQYGTAAQREEVIRWCAGAGPHHGVTWQSIAKDDNNRGKSIHEILELVVAVLQ